MEFGDVLSFGGFCLSLLAICKADSAKKAVQKVIKNRNRQADLQRLANVLNELNKARKRCKKFQSSPQGMKLPVILDSMGELVHSLRTGLPICWDDEHVQAIQVREQARNIEDQIQLFRDEDNQTGNWLYVNEIIQNLIRSLEIEERSMKNAQLH